MKNIARPLRVPQHGAAVVGEGAFGIKVGLDEVCRRSRSEEPPAAGWAVLGVLCSAALFFVLVAAQAGFEATVSQIVTVASIGGSP